MHFCTRLIVAVCAVPLGTMAQSASDSRPPASETSAKVVASTYRSAFSDYRGLTDEKVDWKEANDNVARIGGWRTYLRESQRTDTPADRSTQRSQAEPKRPPVAKPPAPEPSSHDGHKH